MLQIVPLATALFITATNDAMLALSAAIAFVARLTASSRNKWLAYVAWHISCYNSDLLQHLHFCWRFCWNFFTYGNSFFTQACRFFWKCIHYLTNLRMLHATCCNIAYKAHFAFHLQHFPVFLVIFYFFASNCSLCLISVARVARGRNGALSAAYFK